MSNDFFQKLKELVPCEATVTFSISFPTEQEMAISVMSKVNAKDEALNNIVPLNLSGTIAEIDKCFFETITKPMQKSSEVLTNVLEYENKLAIVEREKKETKALKDSIKKEEEKIKKIVDNEKFNALKDFEKPLKMAKELLEKEKNNKYAKSIIEKLEQYDQPDLFKTK